MKEATAYKRSDGWYFHAFSRTTAGIAMGAGPRIKLSNNAVRDELGNAVLTALEGSTTGVPHPMPKESAKSFQPMLDLACVKNWAAFSRGAANVDITLKDERLEFEPWRNAGAREGFVPIPNAQIVLPANASADEIGEALQKAMAIAEQE